MKNSFDKYKDQFTENKLWNKLSKYAKDAGLKVVYTSLLLFYAYKRKETPAWAKRIVLGTLGYLIAPIDMLPDLTPIIGYTDDIGILSFGLVVIAAYVNDDVKTNARTRLEKWFGKFDEDQLKEVEDQL